MQTSKCKHTDTLWFKCWECRQTHKRSFWSLAWQKWRKSLWETQCAHDSDKSWFHKGLGTVNGDSSAWGVCMVKIVRGDLVTMWNMSQRQEGRREQFENKESWAFVHSWTYKRSGVCCYCWWASDPCKLSGLCACGHMDKSLRQRRKNKPACSSSEAACLKALISRLNMSLEPTRLSWPGGSIKYAWDGRLQPLLLMACLANTSSAQFSSYLLKKQIVSNQQWYLYIWAGFLYWK